MTTSEHYIASEFLRYYPDAAKIYVFERDYPEEIIVRVEYADRTYRIWIYEIGSDDDRYIFHALEAIGRDELNVLTVPLMPEA